MARVGSDDFQASFVALELTNFLSYKSARVEFGEFTALVGLNASGKSNIVTALKLLREIPLHGLPTAIARRGGFDQLRHRSEGRPNDPALKIAFRLDNSPLSTYEIRFRGIRGKRYEVKSESASVSVGDEHYSFSSDGSTVRWTESLLGKERSSPISSGQSAISASGSIAAYLLFNVLQTIQTVEVQPSKIRDLQEPSSIARFEPDGSNAATIYDEMPTSQRAKLVAQLAAIVPNIERINVQAQTDRVTLTFKQLTPTGIREFSARQMSDGTLRVFGILTAMLQSERPRMLVVEEPEMAVHLGALRTLVELLKQQSDVGQIVITTHSADIIDSLAPESLRVVWNSGAESHVAVVAPHSMKLLREELTTAGELLRLDALDPALQ